VLEQFDQHLAGLGVATMVPTGMRSTMSSPAAPNWSEPRPASPFFASWRRA
jgi:hypothetical protein